MAGRGGRRRGTVKQSANGTWFFAVDIADEHSRRRRTRRRGFVSQRAAQAALNAVLQDLARSPAGATGRPCAPGRLVRSRRFSRRPRIIG